MRFTAMFIIYFFFSDEEDGPAENFVIHESELPPREDFKPKKTKKKSKSSTNKNSVKETQDGKK